MCEVLKHPTFRMDTLFSIHHQGYEKLDELEMSVEVVNMEGDVE
jgi:hypothetical protein